MEDAAIPTVSTHSRQASKRYGGGTRRTIMCDWAASCNLDIAIFGGKHELDQPWRWVHKKIGAKQPGPASGDYSIAQN